MRTIALVIFIFFTIGSYAQSHNASISACMGALNIFKTGSYDVQFTGDKLHPNQLESYQALSERTDLFNPVWISFIAPADGVVSFEAISNDSFIKFIVFEQVKNNICQEVLDGESEIKRLLINSQSSSIGLSKAVDDNHLYPLSVRGGTILNILFLGVEKSKSTFHLDFNFKYDQNPELSTIKKEMDLRDDDFAPTLSIKLINNETDEPVIGSLTLSGVKGLDANYRGSDFLYSVSRPGDLTIHCDVEGFFFLDQVVRVFGNQNQDIVLKLDPIRSGKSLQIEDIEFKPGTSEFMPSADVKLRRLRDFLALNADIEIEIQGHVFEIGENSMMGQRISEARAKRVYKYLSDNGIDKSRMTTVGYGNTQPLFPDPQFSYEEQANRRVGILVK